jgi:hypothetical protein
MHMSKWAVFLCQAGVLSLISTGGLFADAISFTGLPANTDHGTYNGFVSGTIDGLPFDDLICDDWSHTTYVPSQNLNYNVSVLDTLEYARFASPGGPTAADINNYRAAAILVQGLIDHPDQVADYQYALWELFTPSAPFYSGAHDLLTDALTLVQGDISGYADLFSRLRIYTPQRDSETNQEFLEIDAPAPVPEPGSVTLLLLVMALIASSRIRRLCPVEKQTSERPVR